MVKFGEKIRPRNEKWIVAGNLLRVFVGVNGERFRFAKEENGFARQIVEKRGER